MPSLHFNDQMESEIKPPGGIQRSKLETVFAVVLIVMVTVIAYAILINSFGYYSDEWYITWAGRVNGPDIIVELHQYDRPLMGYIYAFFYRILGDQPLGWQIFAVSLRLLGVMVFWYTLRMIWPKAQLATTSAALLFAVYPGFMVMPKAIIKVNPLFTLACALISIAFTIKSIQTRKNWQSIIHQILAFGFGVLYLFYVEYMIGLEFIRWAFVWIALRKKDNSISPKDHIVRWLLYTGPVTVAALGMMGWRLFFFESGRQAMNVGSITQDFILMPLYSIAGLFIEMIRDFSESALAAWFVQWYELTSRASYRPWVISFTLAGMAVLGMILYSRFSSKVSKDDPEENDIAKSFIWIGILGIFAALLPLMIVDRQILLDAAKYNKYTIHVSASISLLIIGFLLYLVQNRIKGFVVVICILLGLAIQTHYFNGLRYQLDWQYQKDIWWQLTWRAPDLKDESLIAAKHPSGITFSENYEIWAPVNIIYRPNSADVKISGEIISSETEGWFLRGIQNEKTFRDVIPVSRNFGNALILTIPNSRSCMHVINGNRLEDYQENPQVKIIQHTSQIDQIVTETSKTIVPPSEIFGDEPERAWCYYYQKISLAHQRGVWMEAAALADEAADLGYEPLNPAEWIPVLEAYAANNQPDEARPIAKKIRRDPDLRYLYCNQPRDTGIENAYALVCGTE